MRKIGKISLVVVLFALLWFNSCAKRSNPVISPPAAGVYLRITDTPFAIYPTALTGNYLGVVDKPTIHTYLPPGHPDIPGNPSSQQKYPVLYLLADFGQNSEEVGFFYQLAKTTDNLLAAREIDSMVIVVIDGDMRGADANLGGTFYGNSFLVGDWLRFIGEELIPSIDTIYDFNTDPNRRGIAGLGMGGYGAFRIALEYPSKFKAVGTLSAPLALGGTDAGGWINGYLMPTVFFENGGIYDSIHPQAVAPYDKSKPATSWMIAMSAAFSPHDSTTPTSVPYYRKIKGAVVGNCIPCAVDIPFGPTNLEGSVVSRWMDNDIEGILDTSVTKRTALATKAIYLDCGDADEFDFQNMNQRFSSFLTSKGIAHTYEEYSGYGGFDATHNQFAFDRLKVLLKFVSDNW